MRQLEDLLPQVILQKCIFHEKLCGMPYPEVLEAITIASAAAIAVLGVEVFHAESDVLHFLTMSGYEFPYGGDWTAYVESNNAAAENFVANNILGEMHFYILSSMSREEYRQLVEDRSGPG